MTFELLHVERITADQDTGLGERTQLAVRTWNFLKGKHCAWFHFMTDPKTGWDVSTPTRNSSFEIFKLHSRHVARPVSRYNIHSALEYSSSLFHVSTCLYEPFVAYPSEVCPSAEPENGSI